MRRRVRVEIAEAPPPEAWVIAPRPFGHWGQRFERFEASGAAEIAEIGAENAGQRAYLVRPSEAPVITYTVSEAPEDPAVPWIWEVSDNRHTIADPGLRAQAEECCAGAPDGPGKLRAITEAAATFFEYDHPEERFTDGTSAVPSICGTTKGSCTDINTFILAAARSQGLTGQYITGYWFGPGRTTTPDAHCWLAFEREGAPEFWDVAHHLKWGVAGFGPALNPAGGRRVAVSCGMGLVFDTPHGRAEISHLSEPLWVVPGADGAETRRIPLRISLEETET